MTAVHATPFRPAHGACCACSRRAKPRQKLLPSRTAASPHTRNLTHPRNPQIRSHGPRQGAPPLPAPPPPPRAPADVPRRSPASPRCRSCASADRTRKPRTRASASCRSCWDAGPRRASASRAAASSRRVCACAWTTRYALPRRSPRAPLTKARPRTQKPVQETKSTINYHLHRFYRNIIGPHKRR